MKLQGDGVFGWVETVASRAEKFIIVSPFFAMDGEIKTLLAAIPDLRVLIGDEFSTNNPVPLRELSELDSTDVRCIYRRALKKRLHAKVFFAEEKSGRCLALVGSANFTVSGLTSNEEQAVSLDSDCETDQPILEQIEHWIDELDKCGREIDWEQARKEYEEAPSPSFSSDDFDAYLQDQARNYWVLKTTEGSEGPSRWPEFVREGVVSIGWNDIVEIMADEYAMGPNKYAVEDLNAAASALEYGGSAGHAARMLHCFSREFSLGDRVILCRGYTANQRADVHLYGLAVVDGEVVDDQSRDWWRLKRRAVFRRKDIEIPKDVFADALGKGSLLHTIHRISGDGYEEFCRQIREM